jgi:hypothetical protein
MESRHINQCYSVRVIVTRARTDIETLHVRKTPSVLKAVEYLSRIVRMGDIVPKSCDNRAKT